ncbi:MAG TPA: porin family protein [Candidatus Eisenbacteria bacterium]|jgi:hypothetical protein
MHTRLGVAGGVLLVLLANPALALPWHYGARAGVNAANFGGESGDAVRPKLRYGLNAGLAGEAELAARWSVRVEAAYSSKGGKSKSKPIVTTQGNLIGSFDETWSYDYVEVPALVRARLWSHAGARAFAELGPSFGVALRGRFKTEAPGIPERDLKKDMRPIDPGYAGGLGVSFAAGQGRLGIEARFTRGFGDLFDISNNPSSINQVWTLALSWLQ